MYHRISKKTFERRLAQLNKEKKLTKNQKEWEYQAYLLNNRLAAAEKRGFVFSGDVIPERPDIVRKKDIQQLKAIKGNKVFFDTADYVKATNFTGKALRDMTKGNEIVYGYINNASVIAIAGSQGNELIDRNEALERERAYEEWQAELEEQRAREYERELQAERERLQDLEESQYSYREFDASYDDEYYDDSEYEEPDQRYYRQNPEMQYNNTEDVSAGKIILENIRNELGVQDFKLSANQYCWGNNYDIKMEAGLELSQMINGAITEYGEEEVCLRLQSSAKDVNRLVEEILYAFYMREPGVTEGRTNERMNIMRDILFADDIKSRMKYDFHDSEI